MSNLTKNAIKDTFVEILTDRPLSQITVKDIVEKLGINRNTFYYHFKDIPDLIEELVIEETNRIITKYPTVDSVEMAFNAAIDFAEKNRRAINHIYNSVNRDIFENYLWKVCDYIVTEYSKTAFGDFEVSEYDKETITKFYKCQCFGMAMEWINTNTDEDVHTRIKRIAELQKGFLEEIINRAKK